MIRIFDIFFATAAVVIFSPLLVLVILILILTGEHEVFFLQKRIGQNGKPFSIYKFATMLKDSPTIGSGTITSKDDPRILPVGRILRKTKINELPQLFNIILGHMSIIGPRPHAKRDLEGVDKGILAQVLSLKPGLSGVGSLVFRNEEVILQNFDDPRNFYDIEIAPYKATLELWYKKHQSIRLYWKLIFLTIILVIAPRKIDIFNKLPDLPRPSKSLNIYLIKIKK